MNSDRLIPTPRVAPWCALVGALLGSLAPPPAAAHDTWFSAAPSARAGQWQLQLGTGNRFPRHEFSVQAASLQQQGCRHGAAPAVAMKVRAAGPLSLPLQTRPLAGAGRGQPGALTCWAELLPVDISIEPALVQVYLDEIAAPPPLREAWRDLQRRGLPWVERYSKHARIELLDRRLGGGDPPPAHPVPMAMDIVLDSGLERVHAGDEIRFRVLRDGQPLAGQAIEARSNLSPIGLWVRTDPQGRAALRIPLAGSWLLRGTDLRLSTDRPDTWDSRFVTLAFEVAARPR